MGKRRNRRTEEVAIHDKSYNQPKSVWHPLSLQHLRPSQFVDVVGKILDGRLELCGGTLKGATGMSEEKRVGRLTKELTASTGDIY